MVIARNVRNGKCLPLFSVPPPGVLPRRGPLPSRRCFCWSSHNTAVVGFYHEPTGPIGMCVHTFGFSSTVSNAISAGKSVLKQML